MGAALAPVWLGAGGGRKAPFCRLVRSIAQDLVHDLHLKDEKKWTAAALLALQEATEQMLIALFEDSTLCTIHAKRVTLFVTDMQLVYKLRRMKSMLPKRKQKKTQTRHHDESD